jgi:hypothetical protein
MSCTEISRLRCLHPTRLRRRLKRDKTNSGDEYGNSVEDHVGVSRLSRQGYFVEDIANNYSAIAPGEYPDGLLPGGVPGPS